MRKRVIPPGSRIEVHLSAREIEDIRKQKSVDRDFGEAAVQIGADYSLPMTLDEIANLQRCIAAEANHVKSTSLQKRLHQISNKLQLQLDAYLEAQTESENSGQSGTVLAFRQPAASSDLREATIPRNILHRLLNDAGDLGANVLDIRYKDGYEEVFATLGGFSYRIAALRSAHPDAAQLRDELATAASHRKRPTGHSAAELMRAYDVRVVTYDDFGETAYRVLFKPK
ncbi:MAG TPA: hypothetical protein VGQ46_06785 [Thermoanaerobaculia bacterium]|jgi:hypothetical protein|nr:hypothetical protein [Thermoanaerobaculia bacterium]